MEGKVIFNAWKTAGKRSFAEMTEIKPVNLDVKIELW